MSASVDAGVSAGVVANEPQLRHFISTYITARLTDGAVAATGGGDGSDAKRSPAVGTLAQRAAAAVTSPAALALGGAAAAVVLVCVLWSRRSISRTQAS